MKTEIVFILDKSGSMQSIRKDAIGGFNSFIEEQKKAEGEANVTLVLFDSEVKVVYESVDIKEVADLNENTYVPSGLTAMHDAIGLAVDRLSKRLSEQEVQPDNVVFAIMTDGYENASKEYSHGVIKTKIENMQKNDWQFIFLGANIDAVGTAKSIGINGDYAGNFFASSAGVSQAMIHTNEMIVNYRSTGQMMTYNEAVDKVDNKKTEKIAKQIVDEIKKSNKLKGE